MIRITFDIDDLACVSVRAADQPAPDSTVATNGCRLFRALHLVDLFHFFGIGYHRTQVGREIKA
jgi:hypothetical protein